MRKSLKRWSCIAICTSLLVTGSLALPLQSNKASAAEQQTRYVSSDNLIKNPELNPDTSKGNTPHWWYGNNGAKVTSVKGADQDGNNQYVEVSSRTEYYSAMAQNITDAIKAGKDGDTYDLSVWFKLASGATVDSMNLVVGDNVTYTDGSSSNDRWFTKDRFVTANKEQWVMVQTSLQMSEIDTIKSLELVFYSKNGEQPNSFYVDGVSLTRRETPTTTNLFKNPALDPDKTNGNKPSWWYGNNNAKVVTVSGSDADGDNQYVEVTNRTQYYSAMATNITDVIKQYGDNAVYNVAAWFKLASNASVSTMQLKIGLNITYKDGSKKYDDGFLDAKRFATASKNGWVQAKSSFKVSSVSNISNAEIVFSANKAGDISSFYVDGVYLNLIKSSNSSSEPTVAPTIVPTAVPTVAPTTQPTTAPTAIPTSEPMAKTPTDDKKDNPLKIKKTSYTKVKSVGKFKLSGITGKGKLTYKSSDRSVVTVDKKGYVTMKGYGKATIKVKAAGNKTYRSATKKIVINVVPKKTVIIVNSNKKKQAQIKWNKIKVATRYQVKIASNKKFASAKTYEIASKKSSYTVKKLSSKTTYYVKVRVAKKVGKNTVYSAWSKVKKVVIK